MTEKHLFHIVTVGWDHGLVEQLANPIVSRSMQRMSHIVHPRYTSENWPQQQPQPGILFFRDALTQTMPESDAQLLAQLEFEGLPTFHNMILGDRVLSKLPYSEVLGYATFLARRLKELYSKSKPSTVIVGFDSLHAGLALAVAKQMKIPAYALNFSVIPPGLACFCDRMTPAASVVIRERRDDQVHALAESSLRDFESKKIVARAFIAPPPVSMVKKLLRLPKQAMAAYRRAKTGRKSEYLKFTEPAYNYGASSAARYLLARARNARAVWEVPTIARPPETPFVFFGLHRQPESSVDVWAPFFSNQMWVIELLSRSVPPTHKLLVKIHKSDVDNYSVGQLDRIRALPGVELVAPLADSQEFLCDAELVVSIQGTMALEASLMGKPVVLLGDSPVKVFPSASTISALRALPALVRRKLSEPVAAREDVVRAYARYLEPFFEASYNNWEAELSPQEIGGYVRMFEALETYLATTGGELSHDGPKPTLVGTVDQRPKVER